MADLPESEYEKPDQPYMAFIKDIAGMAKILYSSISVAQPGDQACALCSIDYAVPGPDGQGWAVRVRMSVNEGTFAEEGAAIDAFIEHAQELGAGGIRKALSDLRDLSDAVSVNEGPHALDSPLGSRGQEQAFHIQSPRYHTKEGLATFMRGIRPQTYEFA